MTESPVSAVEQELSRVRDYLKAAGWSVVSAGSRETVWSTHIDERELVVVLPSSSEGLLNIRDDLEGAYATLALAERRLPTEVVADVESEGADSLAVRLTPKTPSGTAPLTLAHDAIGALRQYVLGSASALSYNSLVLPTRRPANAETYAAAARLATSRGSFILNLTLPLRVQKQDDSQALFAESLPFGRRVAKRMQDTATRASALSARLIALGGSLSEFASSSGVGNATELEALAHLGGLSSEYRLRFTQSVLAPSAAPVKLLQITPEQQGVLAEAARYLREMQEKDDITVEGKVVRLFRAAPSGPGDVTISAVLDDSGQERRAKVNLGPEDYAEASRAHLEGLLVRVSGNLTAMGTSSQRLEAPKGFTVVSDIFYE